MRDVLGCTVRDSLDRMRSAPLALGLLGVLLIVCASDLSEDSLQTAGETVEKSRSDLESDVNIMAAMMAKRSKAAFVPQDDWQGGANWADRQSVAHVEGSAEKKKWNDL